MWPGEGIYRQYPITHTIHLAAAHNRVTDLQNAYRQANVINAQNVFKAAKDTNILFISTVDVYGFTKGVVGEETGIRPVSIYAKTKAESEKIFEKQVAGSIYIAFHRCIQIKLRETYRKDTI